MDDQQSLDDKLDLAIEGNNRIEDQLKRIKTSNKINRVLIYIVGAMAVLFPIAVGAGIYALRHETQNNSERNCFAINEGREGRIRDAQTLIAVAARNDPAVAESEGAKAYLEMIQANNVPLDCDF